jgi:hypothetical protein
MGVLTCSFKFIEGLCSRFEGLCREVEGLCGKVEGLCEGWREPATRQTLHKAAEFPVRVVGPGDAVAEAGAILFLVS